ncbi:hypothetical protein ACOMHN_026226 [Nucella lapillus]
MEDDGFQIVRRTGRGKRRSKQPALTLPERPYVTTNCDQHFPVDIESLKRRINLCCNEIVGSKFYASLTKLVDRAVMAATHAGPGAPPHPPSPHPPSPHPSAGDSPHQGHGGHCATPGGLNTATQLSHDKQTVRSQFSRQETAEQRLDVNLTQFEFEERLSDSCPECPTKEIGKHCIKLTKKEIEGVEYQKEKAELSGLSLCPSEEICQAAQLLQHVNAKDRKDKPAEQSAEQTPSQNTEEIAEPSAEQNTEEIAEQSAEQTPLQNTEEIAEQSAEETPSQNTEEIAEPSAEQTPSQNTEEIAEQSAEQTPSQNTEEIAEPSAEQTPSQNTEKIAESSAEQTPSQNTEEIAEPSAEQTPSQNTEEIAEPSAEQTPSQNTEEIAESSAEQTPSQNTEEIAEPSAEQTPSQNTEEIAEPSAEETPSQNTEEIAEQPAEQNTEEIAEEPLHANTGLGIENSLHSDSKTQGFLKGTASSSQSVANADIGSRKEVAGTEDGISTETSPSRPATDGGGAGGGGGRVSLLVYGLGNFASCLIARHQLALVLALRQHLQIRPGRCETFDPKYTGEEKQILVDLGFLEITTNEEGKRRVGGPILVVMPHCGKALFNNLLWANWSPQHLQHLVVLGNSFSAMLDSLPRRLWPEHIGYIAKVWRQTREERVENSFVHRDVFNDLSVHWFPAHLLTHAPPALWAHAPEPRYHTDVEIIVSHRPD